MKSKQLKFLVGSLAILGVLAYFGYQGFNESMSYFQTVPELYASGQKAYDRTSLKVQGEVMKGSIRRDGKATLFVIGPQDFKVPENFKPGPATQTLTVRYVGSDALPDTFRDYASAIVTGHMAKDGTFEGTFIQAQCASKYEREAAAEVTQTSANE
jgi:cytochrome c-type biogenesis protein CcmE